MNKIYQLIKMYLSFSISNSVTQEEWNKVYKKTLYLADKLNLADWSKFYYKGIKKEVRTNKKRLSSKEFKELEVKEPTEQIYELIDIRHQFPVRDIDWIHAIDYFNTNPNALKRYYPLFRMKFELYSSAEDIAKALFLNDEFYEFCMKL